MSETFVNEKGVVIQKNKDFDNYKERFNSVILDIYSVSIEIPDFDFNEFIEKREFFNLNKFTGGGRAERIETKKKFLSFLVSFNNIEKSLLQLYYFYKKNRPVYFKLIENEQKIDKKNFINYNDESFMLFFKLKEVWEKYIPFLKIDNINFFIFF